MAEFIKFNNFMIRISEIIFIERKESTILLTVKNEQAIKEFQVDYETEYRCELDFDILSFSLSSISPNFGKWQDTATQYFCNLSDKIHRTEITISNVEKELNKINKKLYALSKSGT